MPRLKSSDFTFRKNDIVGAESAELDRALEDCYYETGDLESLRDCSGTRCVVIGRTGAGKSALLMQLEKTEEHSMRINPEGLSLQYLSNSTILPQVEALGVNLGLFYKLLWRHVFAVELIKAKYSLLTEEDTRNFIIRLWDFFRKDREKEKSIEYLRRWGEDFWKDTEYRVREVTNKLVADIKDSLGVKYPGVLDFSSSEGEQFSVEEKIDVVKRLQEVVNAIQVRELSKIISMLGETVFASPQPRFYVLIDDLDKNWVDERFQYRLIKALLETVSEINKNMPGVKIIPSIRRDLLDRVIHHTREQGFQEEKYEPLLLKLKWSKEQLFEMLDRRVNELIRHRFSGSRISWTDIMPAKVNRIPTADYLIERTMHRPRDLIVFFNICINQAAGKPEVTAQMVLHAEEEYSQKRLRSLYDEWHAELPELETCVSLIKRQPSRFEPNSLTEDAIQDLCLKLATAPTTERGFLTRQAVLVMDDKQLPIDFKNHLLSIFYRVGIIGLRTETSTAPSWSFRQSPYITSAAINEDSIVYVCPMFWRALGITPENRSS